eukprot:28486_1
MGNSSSSSSGADHHRNKRKKYHIYALSRPGRGKHMPIAPNFDKLIMTKADWCKSELGAHTWRHHTGLVFTFRNETRAMWYGVPPNSHCFLTCHFGVVDSWIELFFFKDDHTRNDVPTSGHHVAVQMVGPKAHASGIHIGNKRTTLSDVIRACNQWNKNWHLSSSDCRTFGWHVRNVLGI